MLLTETIRKCTSAVQRRQTAQEARQSDESYAGALTQLSKASQGLMTALDCAAAMREKGIVDHPLITAQMRDDLMECAAACGNGVVDGGLTRDLVKVLQTKSEAYAGQLSIVWNEAAAQYSEGVQGYLSMIGGLCDDPKRAAELEAGIEKTVNGPLTAKAPGSLAAQVAEAKSMTDAFSLSPEIELFLKKVSTRQAAVTDLTPEVLTWLKDKQLTGKLKVRF